MQPNRTGKDLISLLSDLCIFSELQNPNRVFPPITLFSSPCHGHADNGPFSSSSQHSTWEDAFPAEEGPWELRLEAESGSQPLLTTGAQEAAPTPVSQQTLSGSWESREGEKQLDTWTGAPLI